MIRLNASRVASVLFMLMFTSGLQAQEPETKTYRARYEVLSVQTMIDERGKTVKVPETIYLQSTRANIDTLVMAIASQRNGMFSNVSFGEGAESNKLFVNPFLVYDKSSGDHSDPDQLYYYELENRQSVTIRFNHYAVKAITIPIKVRFGPNDLEFTTEANLGVFGGYSWGTTKFTHKEKVGNTEIEKKYTLGVLFGTENLSFEFENDEQQIIEEESALISTGVGFVHSYQNFSVGLTGGVDFALGSNKANWEYHTRPWLGLAIGYSIFSF
jgi:hypothetical protein